MDCRRADLEDDGRGPAAPGGQLPATEKEDPSTPAPALAAGSTTADDEAERGAYSVDSVAAFEAIAMLRAAQVAVRPSTLTVSAKGAPAQCVFLEKPVLKRRKGSDRWVTSGGRKGATQSWPTEENIGVLKRYGRIIFADGETKPVKFAHYTMLSHALDGEAVEDKSCVLWVLAGATFTSVGSKQAKQPARAEGKTGAKLCKPRPSSRAGPLVVGLPAGSKSSGASPALELRATNNFVSFLSVSIYQTCL